MLSGCLPSQAPIPSRWIIDPHEQEDCGSCISGSAFCSLSGAAQHPVVSNEPGICICCCIKSLWIPSQWYEYALPPNPPPSLTSSVTLVGQGLHSICSWSATKFWTQWGWCPWENSEYHCNAQTLHSYTIEASLKRMQSYSAVWRETPYFLLSTLSVLSHNCSLCVASLLLYVQYVCHAHTDSANTS